MVTSRICLTIDDKDLRFIKEKGLSPSRLLRKKIDELKNQKDIISQSEWKRRIDNHIKIQMTQRKQLSDLMERIGAVYGANELLALTKDL